MGHMNLTSRLHQAYRRLSAITAAFLAGAAVCTGATGCMPSPDLPWAGDEPFFIEVTNIGATPIGTIDVGISLPVALESEASDDEVVVPSVRVRRFWRSGQAITPDTPLPPGERAYTGLMLWGGGSDDDGPPPPPPPPPSKRRAAPAAVTPPGDSLRIRVLPLDAWPFQQRVFDRHTFNLPVLRPGPVSRWERSDVASAVAPDGTIWLASAGALVQVEPRSGEIRRTFRTDLDSVQDLAIGERSLILQSGDLVVEIEPRAGAQRAGWSVPVAGRASGIALIEPTTLLASVDGMIGAIDSRTFRPAFSLSLGERTSRLGMVAGRVATVDADAGEVRLRAPSTGAIDAVYRIPNASRLCGADANDTVMALDDCGAARTLAMRFLLPSSR